MNHQTGTIQWRAQVIEKAAESALLQLNRLLATPLKIESWAVADGEAQHLVGTLFNCQPVQGAVFRSHHPSGFLLIAFPHSSASKLISLADESYLKASDVDGELSRSIVTEVGNIFAGAFLSSLADSINEQVDLGAPGYVDDMIGAVIDGLTGTLGMDQNVITWIDLLIGNRQAQIQGHLIFVGEESLWERNLQILEHQQASSL